eukprot:163101-Chlamydomonas_euryale.AAC.3
MTHACTHTTYAHGHMHAPASYGQQNTYMHPLRVIARATGHMHAPESHGARRCVLTAWAMGHSHVKKSHVPMFVCFLAELESWREREGTCMRGGRCMHHACMPVPHRRRHLCGDADYNSGGLLISSRLSQHAQRVPHRLRCAVPQPLIDAEAVGRVDAPLIVDVAGDAQLAQHVHHAHKHLKVSGDVVDDCHAAARRGQRAQGSAGGDLRAAAGRRVCRAAGPGEQQEREEEEEEAAADWPPGAPGRFKKGLTQTRSRAAAAAATAVPEAKADGVGAPHARACGAAGRRTRQAVRAFGSSRVG